MANTRRDLGLIALAAAFAVLAAAVLGTLLVFQGQQRAQALVIHTLEVEDRLGSTLSHLQDAETGQRGYLVTRDSAYLQPYYDGTRRVDADLTGLAAAVADNPAQKARAAELARVARARIERLSAGLDLTRAHKFDRATETVQSGIGKRLMDRARAIIATMKAEENRLLAERTAIAQSRATWLSIWQLLSAAAVAAVALFVTRDARRRAADAARSRDALAEANTRLHAEAASRQSAEAQVRQMHKMESVGQLTGGIAHDFNNMLAIVIGSLDLAKRRLTSDPAKAGANIDAAMQGAERAAQLTARLLAFSRQQPLAPKALDCNKLVGGMSELLRRTIGETVRFETVLAGGLWPAFIDAGQLESALINLCVNGRDAMPGGGRLTVETGNAHLDEAYAVAHADVKPGQYVVVSVTDTGGGMPVDVIDRAFDPFYTTKGVGKGTGLGLSQVYGFVKQSGGHVKIYSEPGVGTTVKLYVPRHFGVAEAPDPAAATGELARAKDDEIVMVVEDEERVRHLSVDSLRELGYVVIHAAGPLEALDLLAANPRVDLLFTDIVMPEMDGRKLAEKAVAARPGLKVLYTTGYTRNAIVHNGVLDHDVNFLAKPFTIAQLAAKVRQVLDAAP
ncbi:MAG: CHASE3 domain-containing protein [Pseudomonadota bacterium]